MFEFESIYDLNIEEYKSDYELINSEHKSGLTMLMNEVLRDNPENIIKLVKYGADIDYINKRGYNVLILALMKKKLDIAILLIKLGADIDIKYGDISPLMTGLYYNHDELICSILNSEWLFDETEILNTTYNDIPLIFYPLMYNKHEIVKALIDHGCILKRRNYKRNNTTLLYLAIFGDYKMFKMVLEHDPEVLNTIDKINNDKKAPLHELIDRNSYIESKLKKKETAKIFKMIVEHPIFNKNKLYQNKLKRALTMKLYSDSTLSKAVRNYNIDIIKKILEYKFIDVNELINDRPLMGYVMSSTYLDYNEKIIVEELFKHGYDINKKNSKGKSVMHFLMRNDVNILKTVLEANIEIDLNVKDNKNNNLIIELVKKCYRVENIKELGKYKLDINAQNYKGSTALHYIINKYGTIKSKFMKYLLEHNANPNIQNKNGNTPLHSLISRGYDILKLMLEHGADLNIKNNYGDTPLNKWIRNISSDYKKMDEEMKLILNYKPNLHTENNDKETLLFSYCGNINIIKILLENGVDPNKQNEFGKTVLMEKINWYKVVKLYLKHGINVDILDNKGNNALIYSIKNIKNIIKHCIKHPSKGIKIVQKILLRTNNIHIKNKKGKNYLDHIKEPELRKKIVLIQNNRYLLPLINLTVYIIKSNPKFQKYIKFLNKDLRKLF